MILADDPRLKDPTLGKQVFSYLNTLSAALFGAIGQGKLYQSGTRNEVGYWQALGGAVHIFGDAGETAITIDLPYSTKYPSSVTLTLTGANIAFSGNQLTVWGAFRGSYAGI